MKVRPEDQLEQDPGGVHDCFKLLFDLEEGATLAQLQEKHSSCADLLDVLGKNYTVEAAVTHINQELAFDEYRRAHDQNRDPVHNPSKIELLARSLPTNKSGITSLHDDDNDCITDDRERMNAINCYQLLEEQVEPATSSKPTHPLPALQQAHPHTA